MILIFFLVCFINIFNGKKLKQKIILKDNLYKCVKIKENFDLNNKLFFYFTKLYSNEKFKYKRAQISI